MNKDKGTTRQAKFGIRPRLGDLFQAGRRVVYLVNKGRLMLPVDGHSNRTYVWPTGLNHYLIEFRSTTEFQQTMCLVAALHGLAVSIVHETDPYTWWVELKPQGGYIRLSNGAKATN